MLFSPGELDSLSAYKNAYAISMLITPCFLTAIGILFVSLTKPKRLMCVSPLFTLKTYHHFIIQPQSSCDCLDLANLLPFHHLSNDWFWVPFLCFCKLDHSAVYLSKCWNYNCQRIQLTVAEAIRFMIFHNNRTHRRAF